MKTIYLHGFLGEKFGSFYKFDVNTPAQALRALMTQLDGFAEAIREGSYMLIRGKPESGFAIDETQLGLKFGKAKEFHIVPVPQGAKNGGAIKTVLGIALIATGFGIPAFGAATLGTSAFLGVTYGTIGAIGLTMTLAGVSQMLTPRLDLSDSTLEGRERPDQRPSFLMSAPTNQSTQGLPVPLVFGRMRVGSTVISSGLQTEAVD